MGLGVATCDRETRIPWCMRTTRASSCNTGVYCIRNTKTGMVYVGSSSSGLARRMNQHLYGLRKRTHENAFLQNAWVKYGEASFEFSIIGRFSKEWCLCMEQFHINKLKSVRPEGYNLSPTAGSTRGYVMSEKSRMLISACGRARGWSPSPEHREAISRANKGKPKSPEHIKALKEAWKARGPVPDWVREKLRASHIGYVMPEEHKKKISAANPGRQRSKAQHEKIVAAQSKQSYRDGQSKKMKAVWAIRRAAMAK